MSTPLERERDWMRTCATQQHRPPDERALFARLADDIDAYLAGALAEDAAPTSEDVALWEGA